jgi:predicted amino acid dehydrogenase
MLSLERKIIILNLIDEGPLSVKTVEFENVRFELIEHRLGWDIETATQLVKKYDGYADAIALSGVYKQVNAGRASFVHPIYASLMRVSRKTPIYVADDVRSLFADWALQKLLNQHPHFFQGKRVLFHFALGTTFISKVEDAGGRIFSADPILHPGTPLILRGSRQIELYARAFRVGLRAFINTKIDLKRSSRNPRLRRVLQKAMLASDIVVTFADLLEMMPCLASLKGKTVVINIATEKLRAQLEKVGVSQIIELTPEHPELQYDHLQHFSVLAAMIDQKRLISANQLGFEEFFLDWIQRTGIKPRKPQAARGSVRRCAFIIHPLSSYQLWANSFPFMSKAPKTLRKWADRAASHYPTFKYGRVEGIVSQATGQEVICDLYALPATPREILSMDEEFLYKRLVETAEMARRKGALVIGLGAYTKVAGDAGVTVAKRSTIPVTNGNSYSASATMWAARVMVERLGFIKKGKEGQHLRAKAMIIGATGSIGRVSALLASLVFDELILVATRADKLLEVRQEILELSPGISVRVTTNANAELFDTDIIVTATSNQDGSVLDMEQVKPGAVICDCSRPLDIGAEEAAKRPDVMVIESGEILLPGNVVIHGDLGLPKPSVYACLAETALLTLEGRFESFSLSKQLSLEKVKEIYKLGIKHGARLSEICGPQGAITEEQIERCRELAAERLKDWSNSKLSPIASATISTGLTKIIYPLNPVVKKRSES